MPSRPIGQKADVSFVSLVSYFPPPSEARHPLGDPFVNSSKDLGVGVAVVELDQLRAGGEPQLTDNAVQPFPYPSPFIQQAGRQALTLTFSEVPLYPTSRDQRASCGPSRPPQGRVEEAADLNVTCRSPHFEGAFVDRSGDA